MKREAKQKKGRHALKCGDQYSKVIFQNMTAIGHSVCWSLTENRDQHKEGQSSEAFCVSVDSQHSGSNSASQDLRILFHWQKVQFNFFIHINEKGVLIAFICFLDFS